MFCVIFKSYVSMLSIGYFSPIVPAFTDVSCGICHAMSWLICALLGGRALGEYGAFRQVRIATFFPYYVNVYLYMTRSADALQTFYVPAFCQIQAWFGMSLTIVFCTRKSPTSRNALHYMRRYNVALSDVLSAKFDTLFGSMLQRTFLMSRNTLLVCCMSVS